MDAASVPSLHELAEPLTRPGALPADISLSVGLIATQPPAVLHDASRSASSEHYRAFVDAHPHNSVILERHYTSMRESAAERSQAEVNDAQEAAAKWQDTLGMFSSVGYTPDAADLQELFDRDERTQAVADANVDESPAVVEARESMIEALSEQADASLRLPIAASNALLSREIDNDVKRLGRRGWIVSTAAGLILGAAATLSFAANHDGATPPAPTATHAEQEKYEKAVDTDNLGELIVVSAGTLTVGGVGFAAGAKLQGQFAHRRARSMLRKAERHTKT